MSNKNRNRNDVYENVVLKNKEVEVTPNLADETSHYQSLTLTQETPKEEIYMTPIPREKEARPTLEVDTTPSKQFNKEHVITKSNITVRPKICKGRSAVILGTIAVITAVLLLVTSFSVSGYNNNQLTKVRMDALEELETSNDLIIEMYNKIENLTTSLQLQLQESMEQRNIIENLTQSLQLQSEAVNGLHLALNSTVAKINSDLMNLTDTIGNFTQDCYRESVACNLFGHYRYMEKCSTSSLPMNETVSCQIVIE